MCRRKLEALCYTAIDGLMIFLMVCYVILFGNKQNLIDEIS